ncbi:AAA family ATPase [Alkanindiges sp. WGS2144]|uniref:AAA family ATPase n=1 Tax=Alkanindiges sp. WGS2144 TaxID=3366808 RepID=UPI00375272C0
MLQDAQPEKPKVSRQEIEHLVEQAKSNLDQFLNQLNQIVLDKPQQAKLALSCILAGGHLLLQDLPGMGKTTLAESLAKLSGLSYRRVQFTSDMLPSDILGLSIFNPEKQEFEFREGPVFTQVLLADEINRTSPKTQSALLEAMEENQVSQDGVTRTLPQPFFVIATQNPVNQSGTYPLPESQLDRFLMCISLGFPSAQAEREILLGQDRRTMLQHIKSLLDTQQLTRYRQLVNEVYLSEPVLDYLQHLVEQTRTGQHAGLSTRGLLALKRAAQAYALVDGRAFVIPEDIQAVFVAVADHRLGLKGLGGADSPAHQILRQVPVIS